MYLSYVPESIFSFSKYRWPAAAAAVEPAAVVAVVAVVVVVVVVIVAVVVIFKVLYLQDHFLKLLLSLFVVTVQPLPHPLFMIKSQHIVD